MSRIGKSPVTIPTGVDVKVDDKNVVTVKGPKGELTQKVDSDFTITIDNGELTIVRPTEQKRHKALHGLFRSLINNMVIGVHEGYETKQELVGVGYKVSHQGQIITFSLGYSHEIHFQVPDEVKIATETVKGKNPTLTLQSADKQLIGHIAAKVRSLRKPEPYKGKGVKFAGEQLRRKAGKSAAKK
jgi:large subunit ribosomal protein L6